MGIKNRLQFKTVKKVSTIGSNSWASCSYLVAYKTFIARNGLSCWYTCS